MREELPRRCFDFHPTLARSDVQFGMGRFTVSDAKRASSAFVDSVDTHADPPNNAPMSKPETVRRIKTFSAATGLVFQYQFQDVHPATRGAASGNEYVYYVSADRKKMFPVRIFVSRDAIARWSKQTGRALTGTEEYAVAKMRLFQALDEVENFAETRPDLTVEESNLTALLERLDL